ncbi:putative DNA binding domain-containing protein [Glaesserella parasuis]|nr:putative DNA binding domain-containing protein [Glaesserella parasuis]MCT8594030.1 putative DNA binding domain-containing protein [Glaesserella parasuis]MCT8716290.1 putative DNA binding domain-containing protein [Glaesserella parasuis]MCT8718478.1 putative DNA binding domain-containing protein [Glaesserella parasuis]MCT8722671.1 putative DNA binding domain-containing protein [Glaesserella parasuis]
MFENYAKIMLDTELLALIQKGEDSKLQFKANVTHPDALAAEMVAFANSLGGILLIGVNDNGTLSGLTNDDVFRLNQLIANVASQNVHPSISPLTENITFPDGIVIVVHISEGISKPYMDSQGYFWTKSGADKRKITAREELLRMFREASLVHTDKLPVTGSSIQDLDEVYFDHFFEKFYGEPVTSQHFSREQLLENMNVMKKGEFNICGALLFTKNPSRYLPTFIIKAVSFLGNDITEQHYIDSKDIRGNITEQFRQAISFILTNIQHKQNGQSFNSLGEPEIPRIVFEELIANAIIHRDYFISAPIRILIFNDRIEIISPGYLPNNLTIENIKRGNSNIRNPILASFAPRALPYRGLGSGILRVLKEYPNVEFIDERIGNVFRVIVRRE